MAGPAAAAAAGEAGDIADAASDSEGFNIALALLGIGALYFMYVYIGAVSRTADEATDGAGDAAQAAGETAGDAYRGTQDVVDDGLGWWAGGGADAVEDGADWAFGGTADNIDKAAGATGDAVQGAIDTVDPTKKGFF